MLRQDLIINYELIANKFKPTKWTPFFPRMYLSNTFSMKKKRVPDRSRNLQTELLAIWRETLENHQGEKRIELYLKHTNETLEYSNHREEHKAKHYRRNKMSTAWKSNWLNAIKTRLRDYIFFYQEWDLSPSSYKPGNYLGLSTMTMKQLSKATVYLNPTTSWYQWLVILHF